MPFTIPNALSIAGSDPSGGAGIQADLKTFSALGVYGMAALGGLTAQNTRGVTAIQPLPAAFVAAQIDAVFEDIRVDAVKLGAEMGAELAVAYQEVGKQARREMVAEILTVKGGTGAIVEYFGPGARSISSRRLKVRICRTSPLARCAARQR